MGWRKRWVRIALVVLVAYTVFMLSGCADRLILFPSRGVEDADGAVARKIEGEEGTLEVWTARSPGGRTGEPEAYVLEFCGNATRAEWITSFVARRWGEHPVEVWCLNYPGYGGSSGKARLKAIGPAALATYDALAGEAKGKPVLVAGHSIGTTAALYVAREREVAGVFLHNPPPLKQLILGKFGWWNLWVGAGPIAMQIPSALDSIENAKHAKAPAVFVLAESDTLVPGKYQRRVKEAYGGEVRVLDLKGASHNDPPESIAPEGLREAVEWLWGKAVRGKSLK